MPSSSSCAIAALTVSRPIWSCVINQLSPGIVPVHLPARISSFGYSAS